MASVTYSIAGASKEIEDKYAPNHIVGQSDDIQKTKFIFKTHPNYVTEKLVDRIFVNWGLFLAKHPPVEERVVNNTIQTLEIISDYLEGFFQNQSFLEHPNAVPIQFDQESTDDITFYWDLKSGFYLFVVTESDFIWSVRQSREESIKDVRMVTAKIKDVSRSLSLFFEEIGHTLF